MSARLDALRAEMDAKFGPPRSGPKAPPTTAMVGVGWSLWERSPEGTWYEPRGGVVVHVDPRAVLDEESGELLDRYLLVRAVRTPGSERATLHWTSLRADQVAALDDGCRPNAATIRGVCQVAARELAKPRRRFDDRRALELWSLGCRLMSVLGAPDSVPPA